MTKILNMIDSKEALALINEILLHEWQPVDMPYFPEALTKGSPHCQEILDILVQANPKPKLVAFLRKILYENVAFPEKAKHIEQTADILIEAFDCMQ